MKSVDTFAEYRRGVREAHHLAHLITQNRRGGTPEETLNRIIRSLRDLANAVNPSTVMDAETAHLTSNAPESNDRQMDGGGRLTDEPRNVEGMTRAEFEHSLRIGYQHDNVRRHVNASEHFKLTDAQQRDIAERVELNYPTIKACPGCHAFDSGMAEVAFVQGCEGCMKRMRIANGIDTPEPRKPDLEDYLRDIDRTEKALNDVEPLLRASSTTASDKEQQS